MKNLVWLKKMVKYQVHWVPGIGGTFIFLRLFILMIDYKLQLLALIPGFIGAWIWVICLWLSLEYFIKGSIDDLIEFLNLGENVKD